MHPHLARLITYLCCGAFALLLPACHRAPPPRPARAVPVVPGSASAAAELVALPSASAARPSPAASSSAASSQAHSDPEASDAATIQRAVGAARRLVQQHRYGDAVDAFDPALGGSEPDTRALSERGYVRMRYVPNSDDEAFDDFWFASVGHGDAAAHAEAWYNLGQLETRRGHLEAARAAFARSLALNPTPAASRALGTRSGCVARVEHDGAPDASLVTGWSAICQAIGRCEGETADSEARARSCVTTSYSAADPETPHGCKSAPPWTSTHDYLLYNWREDFIAPAAHGKTLVVSAAVGGWPAHYQAQRGVAYELHDQIVQARIDRMDMHAAQGHVEDGIGWSSPTEQSYSYFDLDSGALLAVVIVLDQDRLTLALDSKKRVVHVAGPTCGGSVTLAGNARYSP